MAYKGRRFKLKKTKVKESFFDPHEKRFLVQLAIIQLQKELKKMILNHI